MEKYYYLFLNLSAFVPVFLLSFDKKVAFWKNRIPIFLSIATIGGTFIIWDIFFTSIGIWGFNDKYLMGFYFLNIPLEEYLFFLTIPYASIFTFEVIQSYFKQKWINRLGQPFLKLMILIAIVLTISSFNKIYTLTVGSLAIISILYFSFKVKKWMGHFALSFFLILMPFYLIDGIITGSFIQEEIVWYNDFENSGIRIGTIPFEDFIYGFILLLWNCAIFEYFKEKREIKNQ